MSWNLEGQRVAGTYYGQTVTGTVEYSRVKYGGKVQHTVLLEKAIKLSWCSIPTYRILLDADEVTIVVESETV